MSRKISTVGVCGAGGTMGAGIALVAASSSAFNQLFDDPSHHAVPWDHAAASALTTFALAMLHANELLA